MYPFKDDPDMRPELYTAAGVLLVLGLCNAITAGVTGGGWWAFPAFVDGILAAAAMSAAECWYDKM